MLEQVTDNGAEDNNVRVGYGGNGIGVAETGNKDGDMEVERRASDGGSEFGEHLCVPTDAACAAVRRVGQKLSSGPPIDEHTI